MKRENVNSEMLDGILRVTQWHVLGRGGLREHMSALCTQDVTGGGVFVVMGHVLYSTTGAGRFAVRTPLWARDISFSTPGHTSSGVQTSFLYNGYGVYFRGSKPTGAWRWPPTVIQRRDWRKSIAVLPFPLSVRGWHVRGDLYLCLFYYIVGLCETW